MSAANRPILYSFRRCPFAMRARMALIASATDCELREVVLRDKPAEMIEASRKATVPVLIDREGIVRDESLSIMDWALQRNDPRGWLAPEIGTYDDMQSLIALVDGDFKQNLDRYKYAIRYAHENDGTGVDPIAHRSAAMTILIDEFEPRLSRSRYLFGTRASLADIATAPFVRQFANTDISWFESQPCPHLQAWLSDILTSDLFLTAMKKYPQWKSGTEGNAFPS